MLINFTTGHCSLCDCIHMSVVDFVASEVTIYHFTSLDVFTYQAAFDIHVLHYTRWVNE